MYKEETSKDTYQNDSHAAIVLAAITSTTSVLLRCIVRLVTMHPMLMRIVSTEGRREAPVEPQKVTRVGLALLQDAECPVDMGDAQW